MLALDLVRGVAHDAEKIIVGLNDRAVHVELDHGLRLADGRNLSGGVDSGGSFRGHVGADSDDLGDAVHFIADGTIDGLEPNLPAVFAEVFESVPLRFSGAEMIPEGAVGMGAGPLGVDENLMVLADKILEPIAV